MEKSEPDQLHVFLKQRTADVDQELADLKKMEEYVNLGYIDLKPIPIGHDASYEHYSGRFTAWVTPACPNDLCEDAKTIVQKLEDRSSKINAFFKTATPITSEMFINICKAVGAALQDERKTLTEASSLSMTSQA